jgi:hypothetical protein
MLGKGGREQLHVHKPVIKVLICCVYRVDSAV